MCGLNIYQVVGFSDFFFFLSKIVHLYVYTLISWNFHSVFKRLKITALDESTIQIGAFLLPINKE